MKIQQPPNRPPALQMDISQCIRCSECVHGCPDKALQFTAEGLLTRDLQWCKLCLNCVEICPSMVHKVIPTL